MSTLASKENTAPLVAAQESASPRRPHGGPVALRTESGRGLRVRLTRPATAVLALLALPLAGCHVAPPYSRPKIEIPQSYKELRSPGSQVSPVWKQSEPKDDTVRSRWWEVFNDAELNELQEKVNISNQNISAAAASYLAARASVREARSYYYPTATVNPSIVNSRPSPGQFGGLRATGLSNATLSVTSYTNYSLPAMTSWEPDLWSRVRLSTRKSYLAAQASAADLESVRLATHAELAVTYYELCGQDALKELFDSTVAGYREALDLVQAQYRAGISNEEAVASAETQLRAAEAQDTRIGILRAQYEHAIALLIGQSASDFSLAPQPLKARPPRTPVGVPSDLLERRPDVAAAERTVAQANAQIGLARTAFFPSLLLGASGGFGNASISDWFTWPARFWSIGPALAHTVIDGGARRAIVEEAQATHDQTVANYRQTVLTAFRQVEDALASLRILSLVIEQQDAAIRSAERNLDAAMTRYKAGLDPYLNVINAQTLLLSTQQNSVTFRVQQTVACVQLIKALGGSWNISEIPSPQELRVRPSRSSSASQ
jgi:NodT family efflux transporter outer membrane factor (OMF) lipoprotein